MFQERGSFLYRPFLIPKYHKSDSPQNKQVEGVESVKAPFEPAWVVAPLAIVEGQKWDNSQEAKG